MLSFASINASDSKNVLPFILKHLSCIYISGNDCLPALTYNSDLKLYVVNKYGSACQLLIWSIKIWFMPVSDWQRAHDTNAVL
jgi:hypothetical protein